MPPPVCRSPPNLRSTASAKSVTSEQGSDMDADNDNLNVTTSSTHTSTTQQINAMMSGQSMQNTAAERTQPASSGTTGVHANTSGPSKPATPTVKTPLVSNVPVGPSKTPKPATPTVKTPALVPNVSVGHLKPTIPSTADILRDMQAQIAMLQRELKDTQTKLSDSHRQPQASSEKVSDHNLQIIPTPNLAAIDIATTRESQPTHTVSNPTAAMIPSQAVHAVYGSLPAATLPPSQAVHAVYGSLSAATATFPPTQAAHAVHNATSAATATLPPTQAVHAVYGSLPAATLPSSQAVHAVYGSLSTSTATLPPTQAAHAEYYSPSAATATTPSMQPAPAANMPPALYANSSPFWGIAGNCHQQPTPNPSNFVRTDSVAMMPRKMQDLPAFGGEPEDWPLFYTAFIQSTATYGYTNLENNQRLHKCLKGEARDIVKSLLIHPDNVSAVIDQLKFRFGRPEQLIRSQLRQVGDVPHISENNLVRLVPFATKVKNLTAFLQSVNGQQHIANPTLLEELISKLPLSKKLEWARTAANIQPYPTLINFSDWLSEVANLICMVQEVDTKDSKRRFMLHAAEKSVQCPMCQGCHKITECQRFINSTVNDRWTLVKKIHACFSCLNIGHSSRDCHRKKACPREGCNRKHHKLLHEDAPSAPPPTQRSDLERSPHRVLSCSNNNNNKLLFRVLPVILYGEKGRMEIYALFDEGSSITMLDNEVAEQIGVRGKSGHLNIQWFGGRVAREPVTSFSMKISGAGKKKKHFLKNVYAVSNLKLPMQSLSVDEIKAAFKHLPMHLMKPYDNVVPKLLIGLDNSALGLPLNKEFDNSSGPFACNTELGWVVFGPCETLSPQQQSCLFVNTEEEQGIHQMVADYFNVESMGVRAAPPVECDDDVRAKRILLKTTQRVGNRFITGLLWKNDVIKLPDSYPLALSRLEGIERKMRRDENFAAAYSEIMDKYLEKGYIRKVPPEDIGLTSSRKWYLPHFGVTNPNKERKVRLVFDAAAKVNGISLNDNLLKGPQEISSLPSILYNFRSRRVAVGADIREMFHQVLMQPNDRISQRFLWRDGDRSKQPDEYEMMVMTFGAACSPCSAIFVMKANAKQHINSHPRAIEAICDHHYMDDFVDSFDTVEEAVEISNQVREIHRNGGFELRGFISNSNDVIRALNGTSTPKAIPANDSTEKVLGLYWNSVTDTFMFNLKFHRVDQQVISGHKKPTKRQVLSIIMSTFDPLGFLSHYIVGGKLVLRSIWRRDCHWDEPIPEDINIMWEQWRKELDNIADFRLPRFYFRPGEIKQIQLHIFVDSSEEAFAAVAYWRFTTTSDNIGTSFVCSKTKCAPLKRVSIPRLELQAAVLGTRLKHNILSEHKLSPEKCVLWSDSKTVLKWIASSHRRYKPYVAHRIAEILEYTKIDDWRWISTRDNVADDATRAYNKIDFSTSSRWLNGPDFLKLEESEWSEDNTSNSLQLEDQDEEEIRQEVTLLMVEPNFIDFGRFSQFCRIRRTVAWVLRFISRCCKKCDPLEDHGLTSCELENAERVLCLQAQRESFGEVLTMIKSGRPIPKAHKLANLMPYIDDGLLRVYGRIDAASCLPYSARRPIILSNDHYLTELLVMHHHRQMIHQNHEAAICEVRKKYWIPQIRSLFRKTVAKCLMCKIRKAVPATPIMGPLPLDRLEPNVQPFKYTGLDYFGPINVTIGRRTEKRWVALFTCLTIRAIHLELAHDLSTDACIIVMRNFMNRRGTPLRIRSDNGKNFVGANEEAKRFGEVFEVDRIQNELSGKGIEWVFNCPVNPSEGGAWERMVQCVKRVLRHTLREVSPKEYVLQSLLAEAENVVNSRPLTHLPISPHEEEPLTPNHFLIGGPNVFQPPTVDTPDDKLFRLKKQWRVARSLRDRFWKRWVMEYLPTLTRRVKWCERTEPLKEGDMVFICDPNLPRNQWRRGVVTCVYAGSDGVVRRADVRTSDGKLQRAVSKLAVLDNDGGEADRSTGAGVLQTGP